MKNLGIILIYYKYHNHNNISIYYASKLQRQPVPPKATSGDVCSAVIPYTPPGICSCSNNAGGANVQCAAAIGSEDTIYMISQLEVCSNPATVTITLQDGDSGYKFTESMSAGENGSIPTGIMIGVPEFGSAEIVLLYELSGNIDQLHLKLGFDLTATILFETYTCSGYSSECPLWVFDEVIPFGDFC